MTSCDYCREECQLTVVYHQGQKYHPDCFAKVAEEKMRQAVSLPATPEPSQWRRACPPDCEICAERARRGRP